MNFGKYIQELLLENEMVIIPGFGAFVSEHKPAEINEDSDEIKPPSRIITFNQQIRNNDGLLVGYVAEKKRSSHFDALRKIEKERAEILYKLDNGESVELDELGVLVYSPDNKIEFTPKDDDYILLDSFGLETTSIENTPESEEEIQLEPEDSIVEEEIHEPEIEEEPQKIEESVEEETEEKIDTSTQVEPEPEKEEPVVYYQKAEPVPEKKKRGWWWILLVLIPLIAVSVFIFMKGNKIGNLDEQYENVELQIETNEPVAIQKQDTIVADTATIVEEDTVKAETEKPEPKIEPESAKPKYYLVGGSFEVEENAETFLNELKAKGLNAFHVGKKGKFFIVGIGTYDTFNEADIAKQEYNTNNPGAKAWVYKK